MADFIDFFDKEYGPKLGIRAATFRAVLREALHHKAMSIVETGCIRQADNWEGDGQSTIILSSYVAWNRGSFSSVDISQEAVDVAKVLSPNTPIYCQDSVSYLAGYKSVIDLLYLDSFDLDVKNEHPAALHCLFEFCAARPNLKPGSIVCVDDSLVAEGLVVTGKGRYVAEYMKHIGVNPFTWGYQVAWIMP